VSRFAEAWDAHDYDHDPGVNACRLCGGSKHWPVHQGHTGDQPDTGTEALRAALPFWIERPADVPIVNYRDGGMRPATDVEWALWQLLERAAQPPEAAEPVTPEPRP
jgi:hypothetical protein